MVVSTPPTVYTAQFAFAATSSALQVGGIGLAGFSGAILSIGPLNTSRGLYGGFESRRNDRLSWRSLWIPNPARTAQLPVPVGSHAMPTRGCNSAFA